MTRLGMTTERAILMAADAIGYTSTRGQTTHETLINRLAAECADMGYLIPNTIPADVVTSAVARRYDALAAWLIVVAAFNPAAAQ
jgi:hypothetical protein